MSNLEKNYRKIYENHHGSIPKGYHIHHKDGNHLNNHIDNLQCVSVQDHFNIHFSQGDWGACYALFKTGHMTLTPEQRSDIASRREKKKVEDKEHIFLNPEFVAMVAEINSKRLQELAKEGKHPAQLEKNRKKLSERNSKTQSDLSKKGKHVFQKKEHREKLSKIVSESNKRRATGTNWWNNGQKNKQSKECPGNGWTIGRLEVSGSKGFKWWNNGINNVFTKTFPGNDWVSGRIKEDK